MNKYFLGGYSFLFHDIYSYHQRDIDSMTHVNRNFDINLYKNDLYSAYMCLSKMLSTLTLSTINATMSFKFDVMNLSVALTWLAFFKRIYEILKSLLLPFFHTLWDLIFCNCFWLRCVILFRFYFPGIQKHCCQFNMRRIVFLT